eukprot:982113-Prymnesium_polylepis.1
MALAKPATASVALKLIEEKGLEVGDEIVSALTIGQTTEYMLNEEKMKWQAHEDAAVAWGGHIASVHSEEEMEHLRSLHPNQGPFWLGGSRIAGAAGNGPGAEHWEWSDGTSWEYTKWADGQPDNTDQDKVQGGWPHADSLKWDDVGNEQTHIAAIYKRGGRPLDLLVLSKEPATVKLVDAFLARAPSTLVVPAVIAACTPEAASTALKLLAEYPSATLDE